MKKSWDFGNFEITLREVIASITIIAIMMTIGFILSDKIETHQIIKNREYYKAIKITDEDIFQDGMNTDLGNAFVYGTLEAVDTVTYPEIGGEYIYIEKSEQHRNKHTREVTKEDANGKKYKETEEYYQWDTESFDTLKAKEIKFMNKVFPYNKIPYQHTEYIDTLRGDMVYSWSSGEFVQVKFIYYGCKPPYTGTIYTRLKNGTIADNTNFYNGKTIDNTVKQLTSSNGVIIFWIFWIIIGSGVVYCFYYFKNEWLN